MSAFTEANRSHFDALSSSYDTKPWQKAISSQVATALQARKDWLGVRWCKPDKARDQQMPVRLLDYACGTGAITKALGPYVTDVRGVDVSEGMVKAFNEACKTMAASEGGEGQAEGKEAVKAVVGDLVSVSGTGGESLKGSEWYEFDIAVVGLGFHHFEDPGLALKKLAERVKAATGVVVIVDFLPFGDEVKKAKENQGGGGGEEGAAPSSSSSSPHTHAHSHPPSSGGHSHSHTIKHSGFEPSALRDLYTAAGLIDFDIVALKQPAIMELRSGRVERTIFIAKGVKSPTAWQKLGAWVGGIQDMVAGGVNVERKDHQKWEPGWANDNVTQQKRVWGIERVKDEETWGQGQKVAEQRAEKKGWNMGL